MRFKAGLGVRIARSRIAKSKDLLPPKILCWLYATGIELCFGPYGYVVLYLLKRLKQKNTYFLFQDICYLRGSAFVKIVPVYNISFIKRDLYITLPRGHFALIRHWCTVTKYLNHKLWAIA